METTSYFIGLELKPSSFTDLFVAIQTFLKANRIEDTAIIQNILSLHITLYYLSNEYVHNHIHLIQKEIDTANTLLQGNTFTVKGINFFSTTETKRTYYLKPDNQTILKAINTHLDTTLQVFEVQENTYKYIPHITLFTLTLEKEEVKLFTQLETILRNELLNLRDISISKEIQLYAINSKYSPEIQIPYNHKNINK